MQRRLIWTASRSPLRSGDEILVNIRETDGNLDGQFPLDPRITIYNPDGSRFDDASGSFVASASGNALQTGEYLIVVRDNFNNDVGSYDISLLTVPGPANGYATDRDAEGDDRVIRSGERLSGAIDAAAVDLDRYTFTAQAGDEIFVNIRETDGNLDGAFPLDPRITIFNPDGTRLDDASGSFVASAFGNALQSGEYLIVVRDNFNNDVGSYDLSLLTVPGPAGGYANDRDAEGDDRVIRSGDRLSGVIDAAAVDLDRYTFSATAGETAAVEIIETDSNLDGVFPLDPRITVFGPDGTRLFNESGSSAAGGTFLVPQSGMYLILVRDNFNNDVGSYDLTLNGVTPPDIANELPTIGSVTATPNPADVDATVALTASEVADSDGTVAKVDFFFNGGFVASDTDGSDGYSVDFFPAGDFPAGSYGIAAIVTDDDGATANANGQLVLEETVVANQPPTVNGISINPNPILVDGSTVFTATGVNDSDGTVTGVEFFFDGDSLGTDTDGTDGYNTDFFPPMTSPPVTTPLRPSRLTTTGRRRPSRTRSRFPSRSSRMSRRRSSRSRRRQTR